MKNRLFVVAVLSLVTLFAAACGTIEEKTEDIPVVTVMDHDEMTEDTMDEDAMDEDAMDHDAMDEDAMDHDAMDEDAMDHDHGELVDVSGLDSPPTVSVTAVADGNGGAVLEIEVSNFTLVPVSPPVAHQPGQGHAHVYVDGASVAMVHETTVAIDDLTDGHHNIRVTLATNDHREYAIKEKAIAASTSVMVTGGQSAVMADHEITLEIMGGEIMGGIQRLEMSTGEVVAITVTSDIDELLHIHAYDLTLELMAGMPATLLVEANIPGVFEGELHHAGFQVLSLEVS